MDQKNITPAQSSNASAATTPGAQRRILVVEDDPTIVDAIAMRLRAEGFQVQTAGDGPAAVDTAEAWQPDLIVLDVMLPGFDGLEVCRRVQAQRPVPVLMLTARDDETDMLVGLGVGADDYMTKPFSMREVAARVHVLLRRVERATLAAHTPRSGILRLGELEIDHAQRRVRVTGEDVHLTPTEFDLLVCLAHSPRAVLSREQLLAEVWDWADASGTRTVDSHIKALRRKIGADRIRTVHGVGYALETPSSGAADGSAPAPASSTAAGSSPASAFDGS
ncbi:DNA-binding response regulator, OmpR family, contains REC and winged-helix (wHTH) domain [Streptomyces sp. WMMB 714]|jgi:DNA-binding response OmpR family regulator|uniref:response regulator transcription factor n=1 Tax=Streptomyces sp. WMMB 714 TaxID=1286822 RepID=UPI0005F7A659|nr:response regulator transcription factor [Streptomyces sp. WMMB 714]SCK11895.1 DNA-binding response regulator, OmpR family, contains REC and winged-helix (wHTH) domain [Streptomyces sp. WMMB 714]